jgi:hypothetical protein
MRAAPSATTLYDVAQWPPTPTKGTFMFYTREPARRDSTRGVASDEQSAGRRTVLTPSAQEVDVDHRHDMLWWALLIIAFIL